MRTRLSSALDENEQLDNELVGHLVRQAQIRPAVSSPPAAQTTIEVRPPHKCPNKMHLDVDVSVYLSSLKMPHSLESSHQYNPLKRSLFKALTLLL